MKTKKIGNFIVSIVALNEPSEEAILRCRKTITRIMNERMARENKQFKEG